jgi:hypothetical protein
MVFGPPIEFFTTVVFKQPQHRPRALAEAEIAQRAAA